MAAAPHDRRYVAVASAVADRSPAAAALLLRVCASSFPRRKASKEWLRESVAFILYRCRHCGDAGREGGILCD